MSQSAEQVSNSVEQRRHAQRERILDAARKEFIRSGFHAAGMATIARTAAMSPGLIYRYFKNKNAIILAIIEGQLKIARQRIRGFRTTDDLCAGMIDYFDKENPDVKQSMNEALFLEMSAEATRDPEIAQAMADFDRKVRYEVADWLNQNKERAGISVEDGWVCKRALALLLVFAGLKARMAIEPDIDRSLLADALSTLLSAIDSPGK
jgi:AcrR family transcriptional regulator